MYFTSWRACNQWPVPSGFCVLPELDPSQWKPIDRVLTIRCSGFGPFDFFYIAIEFEDVYYVMWTENFVTVKFLSKEQTDRCFNDFARKGFEVMITAVSAFSIRELLWLKLDTGGSPSHPRYSGPWAKTEWRWCWMAAGDKQGKEGRRGRTKYIK